MSKQTMRFSVVLESSTAKRVKECAETERRPLANYIRLLIEDGQRSKDAP